jgi:hypothetical protein
MDLQLSDLDLSAAVQLLGVYDHVRRRLQKSSLQFSTSNVLVHSLYLRIVMLRWQSWLVPLFEPLPMLCRLNFIIAIIVEAYMKVMGLEKGSVRCTLVQDPNL